MLGDYTFTVAFENQTALGYVTEKLLEPLQAGSIPIYWGAAEAKSDFNPEAFIFADDFESFDDLANHVLRIADSRAAVAALTAAPAFRGNEIPYHHRPEYFADRIRDALSGQSSTAAGSPDRGRSLARATTAAKSLNVRSAISASR